MKWMLGTTLGVMLAMSAAANAQSAKSMDTPMKDGKATDVIYTGCIESGSGGGFLLTHIDAERHAPMKGKEMPMKEMPMKGMAMTPDAGAANGMSANTMSDDHMMAKSVRLVGTSNLGKHSGRKVTIKGSLSHESADGMHDALPTLTVVSLKLVSKSCS